MQDGMFPKTYREKEENSEAVKVQFLKESLKLILDKKKCAGCNVCVRACPKEAFTKYTPEGPKELFGKKIIYKKAYYYIPFIHDIDKCVFCGLCTYLCPFDALRLEVNGEIVPPEEIQLVQSNAVPKLESEKVTLENGNEAKVYVEGTISIDTTKCNTGCTNCGDICPTGAIKITPDLSSRDEDWGQQVKFEIYANDCIHCGACHSICPTEALQLEITEVKHSGEYNSPFWDDVENRLKLGKRETKQN